MHESSWQNKEAFVAWITENYVDKFEQSYWGWGEEDAIDTTECWHGNKHGDDDGKPAIEDLSEGDRHRLGAQHLRHGQGGVEGNVGQGVHDGDQDDRDTDGSGKVPDRVFQFFNDKVEIVPAIVGK